MFDRELRKKQQRQLLWEKRENVNKSGNIEDRSEDDDDEEEDDDDDFFFTKVLLEKPTLFHGPLNRLTLFFSPLQKLYNKGQGLWIVKDGEDDAEVIDFLHPGAAKHIVCTGFFVSRFRPEKKNL